MELRQEFKERINKGIELKYIDYSNVSGNTLKLSYNDDTSVIFTPTGGSGGGSGGVSGYAFSSTQPSLSNRHYLHHNY